MSGPRGLGRMFWIVPGWLVLGQREDQLWLGGWTLLLWFGTGVAWQLVYRRDLVDRLTGAAAVLFWGLVFVGVVFSFMTPGGEATIGQAEWALVVAYIVAGLVLTEQWLRWRDHRRARRTARVVPVRRTAVVSEEPSPA